jgi:ribosomal protein L7Ae-like RNA K-turn-binding protein
MRGGMLAVGEDPVDAAVRGKDARLLLVAADAAENTTRRLRHFAQTGNCLWIRLPWTKAELGGALGRGSCALAAVTDIGFASALVRRLADQNPEQYAETAEKLELKARRAAERKAAQRTREKDRKRKAVLPPPAPPEKTPEGSRQREGRPVSVRRTGGKPPDRSGGPGRPADRRRSAAPQGQNRSSRPYANSRPVKKGKGSFRKKKES